MCCSLWFDITHCSVSPACVFYVLVRLGWSIVLASLKKHCCIHPGVYRTRAHIHTHFRQDLPAFPPRQTFSSQHLLYIYTYIECHIRPVIWKPQKKKKKIETCIIRWPWCLLLFLTMWPHCVRLSVLVFVCPCTVSLQDVTPKVRAGLAPLAQGTVNTQIAWQYWSWSFLLTSATLLTLYSTLS